MHYGETLTPKQASPTSTWATARDITLTGKAKFIDITVHTKNVYFVVGGTAAVTASAAFYLPKDQAAFRLYPKPGTTRLGLLGTSTSAGKVFVLETV